MRQTGDLLHLIILILIGIGLFSMLRASEWAWMIFLIVTIAVIVIYQLWRNGSFARFSANPKWKAAAMKAKAKNSDKQRSKAKPRRKHGFRVIEGGGQKNEDDDEHEKRPPLH